ncbi:hypothetical protein A2U01_0070440 [Trifolium medium]|uniref:Uncharacterized protein n=1 Tax=Trifolium medium TaxID=97028 RepID=A0A392SL78_9FABA|nr:hypothetical protein [Trifolium medium]
MADPEPNNNNNIANAGGGGGGARPCHNSRRRLAHLARPQRGARQIEMKTRLLNFYMLILFQVYRMRIHTIIW